MESIWVVSAFLAVWKVEKRADVVSMCLPLCWCLHVKEETGMKEVWWDFCMQRPGDSDRQKWPWGNFKRLQLFKLQSLGHSHTSKDALFLVPKAFPLWIPSFIWGLVLSCGRLRNKDVGLHLREGLTNFQEHTLCCCYVWRRFAARNSHRNTGF